MQPYLLGLDLGGTSVKGVGVTSDGELLARYHVPFDLGIPGAFADAVVALAKQAEAEWGRPTRVGLSAPGIAAADARSIACMPGRFAGLERLVWAERLGRTDPVPVLNDAQAALLGEVWLGAARGARDAILLTLGTGVGGAILSAGQLIRGHTGKAGHLGHIVLDPDGEPDVCQAPGSLEWAVGNYNIHERSGGRFATTLDLIAAASRGDQNARQVWDRSVKALAAALASFGNILDPEVAIIGGGIATCGPALFEPLEAYLAQMEWRPGGNRMRVVAARLGDLAGAYGAAWHARDAR